MLEVSPLADPPNGFGLANLLIKRDKPPCLGAGIAKSLLGLLPSKSSCLSLANLSRTTSNLSSADPKSVDPFWNSSFFSSNFLLVSASAPVIESAMLLPDVAPIKEPKRPPNVPPTTVPAPGTIKDPMSAPIFAPAAPPASAPPVVATEPAPACILV